MQQIFFVQSNQNIKSIDILAKPLSTFSSGYQTLTRRSTARLAPRKRLRKRLRGRGWKTLTRRSTTRPAVRKRLKVAALAPPADVLQALIFSMSVPAFLMHVRNSSVLAQASWDQSLTSPNTPSMLLKLSEKAPSQSRQLTSRCKIRF